MMLPRRIQPKLIAGKYKKVRVVVFVEDSDIDDEKIYRQMAKSQFLKGYADSDSVYVS